jgi:tetratricopeptide (TPR) repeat protein
MFAQALAAVLIGAPTVVVLPFEGKHDLVGDLGIAVQLRAIGTLDAMGDVNVIHPKQLNRVAEHHTAHFAALDDSAVKRELGTLLGADWIMYGTIARRPGAVQLDFEVRSPDGNKKASGSAKGTTLMETFGPFSTELAAVLGKLGARQGEADAALITPVTTNEAALTAYAACYRVMIEQPIGISTPTLLDSNRIDSAIQACNQALAADKDFEDVHAALGFLNALKEDKAASEKHLAKVKDSKRFHSMYWIGKFWDVSRHHDVDAAVATLEQSITRHPGFLIARGYLGDTLVALQRYEPALAAFQSYLQAVPNQPWVLGRIGYVQSKMGQVDPAIESTKAALRLAPSDSELLLEMASRYVDAQKFDEAISILKRIIAEGGARGEVHLRYGYALLRKGQLPAAERELRHAISTSTSLSEWRTRGRARYDLAKIWMQSGVSSNALRELRMAVDEGYRDRAVFENDPDFKALKDDPAFKELMKRPPKPKKDLPKYASPFRLDPESGNIDLTVRRDTKLKQETVLMRF